MLWPFMQIFCIYMKCHGLFSVKKKRTFSIMSSVKIFTSKLSVEDLTNSSFSRCSFVPDLFFVYFAGPL